MNNFIVYKYTAKHNGKIYIGITSRGLEQRWKDGYRANPRLQRTIKKYGKEGFIREVLYDNLSKEDACQKEIELIAKYDAINPDIGYNIALGGTAPMYGKKHSEETKAKYHISRLGEKNSFYGKHHDRENLPSNIPMICLNTLETFPSMTIAGEIKTTQGCTGCSERNISRIKYGQLSAGKDLDGNPLFWDIYDKSMPLEYYKNLYELKKQQRERILDEIYKNVKARGKTAKKQVVDILSNQVYKGANEAHNLTGIDKGDIAQCCRGEKNTCGGTIFLYLDNYKELSKTQVLDLIVTRWTKTIEGATLYPIVCLNNRKLYKDKIVASKTTDNKFSDTIKDCVDGVADYGGEHSVTKQYMRWVSYDKYLSMSEDEIQEILTKPVKGHQPVHCVTTDKYFRDAKSGADYYGLFRQGVQKCCSGKYKTCGEYNGQRLVWEYDTHYRWELYSTQEELDAMYNDDIKESIRLSDYLENKEE